MTNDPQSLLGIQIGPFTPTSLIGQGGFAWVFAGRHQDGTPVALKVLKPRYAGDGQFEGRFRNESTLASRLTHPNIVRILEVGQSAGFTYFAMDLYADSLASRLKRDGRLSEDLLLRLGVDVAAGLDFAHGTGIVHRDIKPDNILLAPDGRAVITDFGIARAVTHYATATGLDVTIGTPQFISPEQAQGRPLDGRSDLYSLGITLYRAATGEAPFRSTDWFELARMHVEDPPVPPRAKQPDLSPRFERVILKCLAKHPDDRYASAGELRQELQALRDGARSTSSFGVAPGTGPAVSPAKPSSHSATAVRALVAVAIVVVVALVFVLLAS